jgi:predicted transcriptional regulator
MNVDTSITARVSNATKNSLDLISKNTQRSRSFHIQQALDLYINDYVDEHKKNKEKSEFMQAIAQGLTDIKQGDVKSLEVIKKQLEIA